MKVSNIYFNSFHTYVFLNSKMYEHGLSPCCDHAYEIAKFKEVIYLVKMAVIFCNLFSECSVSGNCR